MRIDESATNPADSQGDVIAATSEKLLRARIAGLEADNARLRKLLEQQGLPAELRHQVRNTLARIRSVIRRTSETGRTAEDYAAHLEGRFDAILRVQNVIARGQARGVDLHTLISDELLFHTVAEGEEAWLSGPAILLQPKAAEALALAVHELTTNALEHGALGRAGGKVVVSWKNDLTATEAPLLSLEWREVGSDACKVPASTGFGTDVLRKMLRYEIGAETTLDYERSGLHCTIRIPLSPEFGLIQDELEHSTT